MAQRLPRPDQKREKLQPPVETLQEIPEWLEEVRISVERQAPLMQTLFRRSINGVLRLSALSEESVVNAASAPTDLGALVRALASQEALHELIEDLKQAEPLAPAFLRGIEAKRRALEESGGVFSAEQVAAKIGISRQAVEGRRQTAKLIAVSTGRHGNLYPVWQFERSGVLAGLPEVLTQLSGHDEWAQLVFFVSKNPRLDDRTPIEMLKAGNCGRSWTRLQCTESMVLRDPAAVAGTAS